MDLYPEQSEKHLNPISPTEPGIVTVVKPVQFSNAMHSILFTLSGICMDVIPLLCENASIPIISTDNGIMYSPFTTTGQ